MTTILRVTPTFSVDVPPLPAADRGPATEAAHCSISAVLQILKRWPELAERTTHASSGPMVQTPYGVRPSRGVISAYPIFCALWCQPLSAQIEPIGRASQAALLGAYIILSETRSNQTGFASALGAAGLATRHILSGNIPGGALAALTRARNLTEAYDALVDAGNVLNEQDQTRIRGLPTLIRYALDSDRSPPARQSNLLLRQAFGSVDPDPADGIVAGIIMEESRRIAQATADGGAPFAEHPPRQLALIRIGNQVAGQTSQRQAHWRAKHQARAMRARSQGLICDADRLQLVDVIALQRACLRVLSEPHVAVDKRSIGLVSLALSLLTGLDLSQLSTLRYKTPQGSDATDIAAAPRLLFHAHCLILPAAGPQDGYVPECEVAHRYRTPLGYLVLRVPDNPFYRLARRFFKEEKDAAALLRDAKMVETEAQTLCRDLNKLENVRLTASRVARFLFDQARSVSGDWAEAAHFRLGAFVDARRYYYCPRHERLAGLYTDVWASLDKAAGSDAAESREQSPTNPVALSGIDVPEYVGCAACPTVSSVNEMVKARIDVCTQALVGRPGPKRARKRHNALALYSWLMLMWMTGIRPVDESIELANFDPYTSLLFVSDKDTDAYCASRVVWIPKLGRRQIENYLGSVERLRREFGHNYADEFFFVNRSGKPVPLSVANIRKGLKPYPFRLNTQRHFLRTELRERGATAQSVDALLGHGGNGHEPFARHSAFSAQQMIRELREPLQDLIRVCGWIALPGGQK